MSQVLPILQQSPLDPCGSSAPAEGAAVEPQARHWVPSRYNARAVADDGRLVIWNTYKGSVSVFPVEQKERIIGLLHRKGFEAPPEGIVAYLVDRGFLIPRDADEYRRLQVDFGARHYRPDALALTLLASEDCNFRCTYCYEQFARGTMRPGVREGLKKLVESRLPSLHVLHVSWFGGEPLYGWDAIADLGPFFHRLAQEHDLAYESHMTTNGYLLTPEVADQLLEWQVDDFQITLDGPEESHDQSRPARTGDGTFERIFQNLRSLQRRDATFKVAIRVNFDVSNHPKIEDLLNLVETDFRGDSRFTFRFYPVGRWGGADDADLDVCGKDEGARIRRELDNEAKRRGLSLADSGHGMSKLGDSVCYAAQPFHFIVGADGKLMKCTVALDTLDENVVGQLRDDGTWSLDPNKIAQWSAPAFEHDDQCKKCLIMPVCQGMACPLTRIDRGERSCPSLRQQWKRDLINAVRRDRPARTQLVTEEDPRTVTRAAS